MKTLSLLALGLLVLPWSASAINKCVGADGKVTYTDEKCPSDSKASGKLAELPPPRPEDVLRAQEEAERIKDEVRRSDARRDAERERRAREEREASLERQRQELIELERRKVEALENQARMPPPVVPVVVVRDRSPRQTYLPPPSTAQSQPRDKKKPDTTLFGPRLPTR